MEIEGYKKDDQDNQNKDGIEEDLNVGGTDILDWASTTFTNETDDKTTMIVQTKTKCRLGITR